MPLDRIEERRRIGLAVREMEIARRKGFADAEGTLAYLRGLWDAARREYGRLSELMDQAREEAANANSREVKAVLVLESATPGLLLQSAENLPHGHPGVICCELTGLAIFEDDELIGDYTCGPVILKAAMTIDPELPVIPPLPPEGE